MERRIFWTIQPSVVFEKMKRGSPVYVEPDQLPYGGHIPESYLSLATYLKRTMNDYSGKLPWWLYSEKPDLRTYRHTRSYGKREVRIELTLPRNRYAEFSLKLWNSVYSGRKTVEALFQQNSIDRNSELIAVTETLSIDDVKKVHHFVGTNRLLRLLQDRREGLIIDEDELKRVLARA